MRGERQMATEPSAADEYLASRHATFNVDQELVYDLVRRCTGCTPNHRQKVVRGNDNEVYRVSTDEQHAFIVRIHRDGEVTLSEEHWAIGLCQAAGVLVPQVRFVGIIESASERLEVMVQDALPGQPLSELARTLGRDQISGALHQAGRELAKIHTITAGGFYHYHPQHGWDFKRWEEIAEAMVRERSQERELIVQNGFDAEDFSDMVRSLELYKNEHPCESPVLCHGDYLPKHLFFDQDIRLTGIIDFGMFQGGPAVHDLAMYNLNRPDGEVHLLLSGYRHGQRTDADLEIRLNLSTLAIGMGFLAHETKIGNTNSARHTASRLRAVLTWCRRHSQIGAR